MTTSPLYLVLWGVFGLIMGNTVLAGIRQKRITNEEGVDWSLVVILLFANSTAAFLLLVGHPITNVAAGILAVASGMVVFVVFFKVLKHMVERRRREGNR